MGGGGVVNAIVGSASGEGLGVGVVSREKQVLVYKTRH